MAAPSEMREHPYFDGRYRPRHVQADSRFYESLTPAGLQHNDQSPCKIVLTLHDSP